MTPIVNLYDSIQNYLENPTENKRHSNQKMVEEQGIEK
jgi:hypothetical protein